MQLISPNSNLNFMKYRYVFFVLSIVLISYSIFYWIGSGENKYSVDFLGGAEILIRFDEGIDIATVRELIDKSGVKGATVQAFLGEYNEYSIRLKAEGSEEIADLLVDSLASLGSDKFDILKEDIIGPAIGAEIKAASMQALLFALIGMLIYISVRFEFRFAVGAIVALIHDVIITTGAFIVSGREIDSVMIAALLMIVGYSVNDTIIVYDRIRENINQSIKNKTQKEINLLDLINQSLNQTLSRTLLTSLTTLFVAVTLFTMGGGALGNLSFPLVVGIIVGTYSTIFIASTMVLLLEKKSKK
jgi:preprotein translocase subunit SecF